MATIEIPPMKWGAALGIFLAALENGTPAGKQMAREQLAQMAKVADHAAVLREALGAAQSHLDYCGYGDKWERECADAAGLEAQIMSALEPA